MTSEMRRPKWGSTITPPTMEHPRTEHWVLEFLDTASEWKMLSPSMEFDQVVVHYSKHYAEQIYSGIMFRFRNTDNEETIPVDFIQR